MQLLDKLGYWIVLFCWLFLILSFIPWRGTVRTREVRRARSWKLGLLLQAISIGMVWGLPRPRFTPILNAGPAADALIPAAAVVLAVISVWFMAGAKRALGRQWAYEARLVEGHKLVTGGPYRFVRHPIYTAFGVLAFATALVYSHWIALAPFLVVFSAGTAIRVRCEEALLRDAFREEYESYARRVPAVLPGLR